MTRRPTKYLLEGELENTKPGKVTGWMKFADTKDRVTFVGPAFEQTPYREPKLLPEIAPEFFAHHEPERKERS